MEKGKERINGDTFTNCQKSMYLSKGDKKRKSVKKKSLKGGGQDLEKRENRATG